MRFFIGLPGPFGMSFRVGPRRRTRVVHYHYGVQPTGPTRRERREAAKRYAEAAKRYTEAAKARRERDDAETRTRLSAPCPEPAHLEWARPSELRLGDWIEEDGLHHIVALRQEGDGYLLIFADGAAWNTGTRSTVNKVVDDANGRTGLKPLSHKVQR